MKFGRDGWRRFARSLAGAGVALLLAAATRDATITPAPHCADAVGQTTTLRLSIVR